MVLIRFIALISIIFLSGCSNLTVYDYEEPVSGEIATIEFRRAVPYEYKDEYPFRVRGGLSLVDLMYSVFSDDSAMVYDDPDNCKDYATIDLHNRDKRFSIAANGLQTFGLYVRGENSLIINWCSNKFSFKPESNEHYRVDLNLRAINDMRTLYCEVQVFKEDDLLNPIDIIDRNDTPIAWLGTSPTCKDSEVEEPEYVKRSVKKFDRKLNKSY